VSDDAGVSADLDVLERWVRFGGACEVVSRDAAHVIVSLRRCDGGEEMQRLTSAEPDVLSWLDTQAAEETGDG
jgi:hypothetical protein